MLPVPINLEERFGALLEDCADDTYDMALYFLEKTNEDLYGSIGQLINYKFFMTIPLKSFEVSGDIKQMLKDGKTMEDIKNLYTNIRDNIENDVIKNGHTIKHADMFKKINLLNRGELNENHEGIFISEGKVLELYLNTIIESFEFYQTLLYRKVIIVEGLTEKLILQKVPLNDLDYQNFYFSNGKIHFPFYIELFKFFGLDVVAMFDSDEAPSNETNGSSKFVYKLTCYLKQKYLEDTRVKLIVSQSKDLEQDYEVNQILDDFSDDSGINKNKLSGDNFFKPYIASFCFEENNWKYEQLSRKIIGEDDNRFEFN